jgi:hypothetical protein
MHGALEPVGARNTHWLAWCVGAIWDDEGVVSRGAIALRGQHLEVTPAVPVVIRQDCSDRRRILCPDHGGFLLLRVPVPHPFVQHRPDGVAFGEPERHPVRCQALRAGMHHARQMSHGVSPCSMHDDRASVGARNTHWLAVCVMAMRYDAGWAGNCPVGAAVDAWPGVAGGLRPRRPLPCCAAHAGQPLAHLPAAGRHDGPVTGVKVWISGQVTVVSGWDNTRVSLAPHHGRLPTRV